jgi:hypothetical protein
MFEPETILHQVWQQDIPPGWQVYPRWRFHAWKLGGALVLLVIIAALSPLVFAPSFWLHNTAVFIGIILVAIVGGSLFLAGQQGGDLSSSRDPDSVLVVTPEGVVEYINTHDPIYTIPFAEINELHRHQDGRRSRLEVVSLDQSYSDWTPRVVFGSNVQDYGYKVIFARIIAAFDAYKTGENADRAKSDGGRTVL